MNKFLFALFIVVLGFVSPAVSGRDYPMVHFTVADGLPSNTVYSVYRDKKGFIWLATDKGIARYNGIKFEKFTTFDGLADNEIFHFCEDQEGRMWMATYNGHLCYIKDDSFHNAGNTPFLNLKFKPPFIEFFSREKDSSITMIFEQMCFVNIKNEKVKFFDLNSIENVNLHILQTIKLPGAKYEVVFQDKIVYLNDDNLIIGQRKLDGHKRALGQVYYNGSTIAYSADSFFLNNEKIKKLLNLSMPIKEPLQRTIIDGGNAYTYDSSGCSINGGRKVQLSRHISSVCQDETGGYWVSTVGNGLFYLYNDSDQIRLYKNIYKEQVKYCCIQDKRILFATEDNNVYQFTDGQVKCLFDYRNFLHKPYKFSNEPGFMVDDRFRFYSLYNSDHLVIDNIFHPQKIDRYYSGFLRGGFKKILYKNNCLYVQIRNRLIKFDYRQLKTGAEINGRITICNDSLNTFRIFCTAMDRDSGVWYSTINAVYKVVNDKGIAQPQFKNTAFKTFSFFGNFLVGYTHENQLLVCRNVNDNITVDTIPSQNCVWDKLYKIDPAHIIISTNNLYRLLTLDLAGGPGKPLITAIENPFLPTEPEAVIADATTCYFFKNGSVTAVSKDHILLNPYPPKLMFKYIKIANSRLAVSDEMQLPFKDYKNIGICFSALAFMGKNISYVYSIVKNGQDNWRELKGDELNLINPGYGRYVIKIKAKTESSGYCQPIMLVLNIDSPYWAKWWFIAIVVLFTAIVIIFLVRRRIQWLIRQKEKKHSEEIKFIRSEYKALNALMNPHFIFNTINNVQSLYNDDKRRAANEYLRVFADLIRQNMHNVSKELIPLQKEIDLVNNYLLLEKLRFEDDLDFSIDLDPDLDLTEIMLPPLLLQPIVENAIKHGILPSEHSTGRIIVSVYRMDGKVIINIKDNGVGIEQPRNKIDSLHESYGLENIKQRLRQLNILQNNEISFHIGTTKDEQGQSWTTVTIAMPFAD